MADTKDETPETETTETDVSPVGIKAEPVQAPAEPIALASPESRVSSKAAAEKGAPKKASTRIVHRKVKKPGASKPVAKTASSPPKNRAARAAKRATAAAVAKTAHPRHTITELKEKTMATAKTDFTKPMAEAVAEFQSKAKTAFDKSAGVAAEVTEFTKGNVEALVESGKIFAAGAQSLGKTYADEAKTAYEVVTADLKELAAVKSPAELFQLQSQIARRNFDAFVAASSKNTESFLKLANDAFVPLTGRVEVATEKLSKVA